MVPVIPLLVKVYVLKRKKLIYFPIIILKMDSSFNIQDRLVIFSVVIIDMSMEGTMLNF